MKSMDLAELIRNHSKRAQIDRSDYERVLIAIARDANLFAKSCEELKQELVRLEKESESNRSFDPEVLRMVISYKAR
jgi:hypothetical protein